MTQCECGGTFVKIEGLEGMYCEKCNNWVPENDNSIPASLVEDNVYTKVGKLYDVDRIRAIRGVPLNEICIGSETKGRVKISIPSYATPEEAKALISINLDLLQYTKNEIERRGLDIFSSRGKKNEL